LIDPLAESLVTGTLQLIVQAVEAKLYALLMIGVDEPGKRHFLVIEDGVRESTQSWRAVLLGLKSHGMNYAGVGRWRWCHWFFGSPWRRTIPIPRHSPAGCIGR